LYLRSEVYGFLTKEENRNRCFCQLANEYISDLDIESLRAYSQDYVLSGQDIVDKNYYESAVRKIYLVHGALLSMDAMSIGSIYAMNPFTYLFSHIVELSQSGCLLFREDYRAELMHLDIIDRAYISAYLTQDQIKLDEEDHEFLLKVASGIPSFLGKYVELNLLQMEQIVRLIRLALQKRVKVCIPSVVHIDIQTTKALENVDVKYVEVELSVNYEARDELEEVTPLWAGDGPVKYVDDPKLVPVLSKLRLADVLTCSHVSKRWYEASKYIMRTGQYRWPTMEGYPYSVASMAPRSMVVSNYIHETISNVCNKIVYDVVGNTVLLQASLNALTRYFYPDILALTSLILMKCKVPICTFVKGLALMEIVYDNFSRDILYGIKGLRDKVCWRDYPNLKVIYRPLDNANSFKRVYDMLLKRARFYNGLKVYVRDFNIALY